MPRLALPLVLLVTLLVFGQVVGHSLLTWDDDVFLYTNPLLQSPGLEALRAAWVAPYADLYAPLPLSVWIGLTRVFLGPHPGLDSWQHCSGLYHLANLLGHLLAVVLVYRLLARLSGGAWPAAAGALLFAVHPLQVETVAWASELKDVLAAVFALAAVSLVVAASDAAQRAESPRTWRDYRPWLATLCLALGLLCKPSVVALPLLVLTVDLWLLRTPWRVALRLALPWLLGVLLYAAVASRLQTAAAQVVVPLWQRPFVAGDALAFYLVKLLVPLRLCADYGRSPATVLGQWWGYATWALPALLLGAATALRRRSRWALPALLWFLLALVPVLGLLPFDFQQYSTVADHYAYLALVGPAVALAGLARHLRGARPRLPLVLVLALLAGQSALQTITWQSNLILWQSTLAVNPRSFPAHDHLGTLYAALRRLPEARQEYETALRLRPGDVDVIIKLGLLHMDLGDRSQAREYVEQAVRLRPADAQIRQAAANLALTAGDYPAAVEQLRALLALHPGDTAARHQLQRALHRRASPPTLRAPHRSQED